MGSDGSCFSLCFCFELGLGRPEVRWVRVCICDADEEGGGFKGNDGCGDNVVVGIDVEMDADVEGTEGEDSS